MKILFLHEHWCCCWLRFLLPSPQFTPLLRLKVKCFFFFLYYLQCILKKVFGFSIWGGNSCCSLSVLEVLHQLRSLICLLMCAYMLTVVPPTLLGLCWLNHSGELYTGYKQNIYVLHCPDWHNTQPISEVWVSAVPWNRNVKSLHICMSIFLSQFLNEVWPVIHTETVF